MNHVISVFVFIVFKMSLPLLKCSVIMISHYILVIKNKRYTSNNLLDYSALIISDLDYCLTGERHCYF